MSASDYSVLDVFTHCTLDQLHECKAELKKAGMLRYDDEQRVWWVPKAVRPEYNTPSNPKQAMGWARKLAVFDRSDLVDDYRRAILAEAKKWGETQREAFLSKLQEVGIDPDEFGGEALPEVQGVLALEAPAAPEKPVNGAVRTVFAHWCEVMQHPGAALDKKRERVIKAALKLRPLEDCLRAVDGCKASAWHMGENDRGKVYDSLGLIFRDAEHLERFIGYLDNPNSGAPADGDSDLYRYDK